MKSGGIRGEGLHHVLVESDDVNASRRSWLDSGATEPMTGGVPEAGRFIHLDVGDGGPYVGLIHPEPRFYRLFEFMQRQAAILGGGDPIRPVPAASEWEATGATVGPNERPCPQIFSGA